LPFEALGSEIPPYAPTYAFPTPYINAQHAYYATCPLVKGVSIDVGIRGSLRREDALKLYELAYFADGDVLELGCNLGLSTSILSRANHDAGLAKSIYTNDLDARYLDWTRKALEDLRLVSNLHFYPGDAVQYCQQLASEQRQFAFAFVDHSHAYEPVYGVCESLPQIIKPGGLVLFHDYNDYRNPRPDFADYGVAQAVIDALAGTAFEFYGLFGCTALYRKGCD
jgi:SAM-dependent methyltransferase